MSTATSVIGPKTIKRFDRARREVQSGFTLLEILVVVTIIAIMAGIAILSTDIVSFDKEMEREARRLESLIRLTGEEALLEGKDLGLQVFADGYRFLGYNHDLQAWLPLSGAPGAGSNGVYRLDRMELRLRVEDRDIELETYEDFEADWLRRRDEETDDRETDPDSAERSESEQTDQSEEPVDNQPPPPIVIFSSGEMTPFELEVLNASDPFEPGFLFLAEFDGTIEIDRSEF